MTDKKHDYCSFMLRLWIEKTNGEKWRFSLEDTHTGKRKGFASVDKLIAYLEEITNESLNFSNRTE